MSKKIVITWDGVSRIYPDDCQCGNSGGGDCDVCMAERYSDEQESA